MIVSESQIQQIIDFLQSRLSDIEGIYLFGSGATNNFNSESDIDLAIKLSQTIDQILMWHLKNDLSNILKREVDLIDLSIADTVTRMQVVSNGIRIFSTNIKHSEAWDSLVYSMYLTLNEDRKEILKEIKKTGKIYG